jgi:hypothetical protein
MVFLSFWKYIVKGFVLTMVCNTQILVSRIPDDVTMYVAVRKPM